MPSINTLLKGLVALAPLVVAAPARVVRDGHLASASAAAAAPSGMAAAAPAPSPAAAPAAAAPPAAGGGLTDIDILQFALTLEHLESEFYKQGFAKFPDSEFAALGLTEAQIKSLKGVGETEAIHVSTLLGSIASAGAKPVEPCQYNFEAAFADAKTMVATARVLEAVGVSAYLGAAPVIQSADILTAAATIVTVEARHQAFIRVASGAEAVPAPFDTPLGPKAVFTLAAAFISSCPEGSNLAITAFPSIALTNPEQAVVGQNLKLADAAQPSGAAFCAFVGPAGPAFEPITDGSCVIPQNLAGEVYMLITKSKSVADAEVLAGPSVIQPS
ncbi:ferritin-like domain-containing protein [Massariosphaeria phaeospora]|uniref:Ferritin-like domain-containing protein n=1 Tax=Massariosphaeria phaeospora TaxID=100035 RepID=A0A7C8M684_9PLEO|nr:ferritin-like domain-containing protein [Massariosphaeria phaeospora]